MLLSPQELLQYTKALGYFGIALVIFVETGLFFGFVLPGDSLLFIVGMLAASGVFHIGLLLIVICGLAFVGYLFGYWFGDRLGSWLMNRKESIFFRKQYIESAKVFYQRHGAKAIIIARVVPIVRTFAPIVAGMVKMPYKTFFWCNLLGAVLWGLSFVLAGFFLGNRFPLLIHYLLPMVVVIIILSIAPGVISLIKNNNNRAR